MSKAREGLRAASEDIGPQMPLPQTSAELRHLWEKLNTFISNCIHLEADIFSKEAFFGPLIGIKEEDERIERIQEQSGDLSDSERIKLMESSLAVIKRYQQNNDRGELLSANSNPQQRFVHILELETHSTGLGAHIPIETRQEFGRLWDAYEIAAKDDANVAKQSSIKWGSERVRSHWKMLLASRLHWKAARVAMVRLREEVVKALGALEAPSKPAIEIELDREESDIVRLLHDAGRRMTTSEILAGFSGRGEIKADSTVKLKLSQLTKRGILNNRSDLRPRGYGLPDWK